MLNYRLVAILILIACVVSPIAIGWVNQAEGSWLRPYVVWLLAILACFIWQRPPRSLDSRSPRDTRSHD